MKEGASETEPCTTGFIVSGSERKLQTATTEQADEEMTKLVDDGLWPRRAKSVGRYPWTYFLVALIVATVLSVMGLLIGNFSDKLVVDNKGWQSRGTELANREAQRLLVHMNRHRLAFGPETDWVDMTTKNQPSWAGTVKEVSDIDKADNSPRHLEDSMVQPFPQPALYYSNDAATRLLMNDALRRKLLQLDPSGGGLFHGCDTAWYTNENFTKPERLWAVWRMKSGRSAANADSIEAICDAELETLSKLRELELCFGCDGDRCLPPFSLVLFARLTVGDIAGTMTCSDLSAAFAKTSVTENMATCVFDIVKSSEQLTRGSLPPSCPEGFNPALVDKNFGPDNLRIQYTSSIFPTYDSDIKIRNMYENVGALANGSEEVAEVAYDTQYETFATYLTDVSMSNDLSLALASAVVTCLAILIHTKSPWLTVVGIIQITFSFPLAYFFYTLIARLEFFPFLNFIGVFVVLALGADDIFVATDKLKNARLNLPSETTTEDVAAVALPDAAAAMFQTTVTTAIAFFATAISPVAPVACFAIFCGFLVIFDYIMCCVLFFPALCLYDKWLYNKSAIETRKCYDSACISCCGGVSCDVEDEEDRRPSLIHHIMLLFYQGMSKLRWPLLAVIIVASVLTAIRAAAVSLPSSIHVRVLSPRIEYEKNFEWRQQLLSQDLDKTVGSQAHVIWGVVPSDTGRHTNPSDWTKLVLDESFDPSSEEAQLYLRDFCDNFFVLDQANRIHENDDDNDCSMKRFDRWLGQQSEAWTSIGYATNCDGALSLPLPQDTFHACVGSYQQEQLDENIMIRDGKVRILTLPFQSRVGNDSHYEELEREWKALEAFCNLQRMFEAPSGVRGMYHSNASFWRYDTTSQMLITAYSGAMIALGAATLVVLFVTRSFTMTIFSIITISFVLTSTTSVLVATGWTLGFLESVCFAVLIGVSCDFVLHIGHAYCNSTAGNRHDRTKHALITMGPSILAAAITTISAAIVMFFTVTSFFQKFGFILLLIMVNATVASLVMFPVLTDSFGPTEPTLLIDSCIKTIAIACCKRAEGQEQDSKQHAFSKDDHMVEESVVGIVDATMSDDDYSVLSSFYDA